MSSAQDRILVVLQRYPDEGPGAPASAASLVVPDLDSTLGDGGPGVGPPLLSFQAGVAQEVGPQTWSRLVAMMFEVPRRVPRPYFRLAGSSAEAGVDERLASAMADIAQLQTRVSRLYAAKKAQDLKQRAGVAPEPDAMLERSDFRCAGCGELPPVEELDPAGWLQRHIGACESFTEMDSAGDLEEAPVVGGAPDLTPAPGGVLLPGTIDSVADAARPVVTPTRNV